LQAIWETESEKYQILTVFEEQILNRTILPTLDDFRKVGQRFDKLFSPGRSRKEALKRLMALLVPLDLDTIRTGIASVPQRRSEENAYLRLANYIISGGKQASPAGEAEESGQG